MKLVWEDTIVGPATPAGSGARAILRLAGPQAPGSVALLVNALPADHSWHRRGLFETLLRVESLTALVPCLVYHWPAGGSATAQPMVELHLPASPIVVSAVELALRARGVRLAQPGEFTLRSFLAGRLDLAQAEGVLALIEAEDADSLRRAMDQRGGGIGRQVGELRQRLIDLLADLEAGLDFVEEDISFISDRAVADALAETIDQIDAMLRGFQDRQSVGGLARVVLFGPANAGKSSLLNALAQGNHAIVSPTAGTTRDWVSVTIQHPTLSFELIDTAGYEPTGDALFEAEIGARREDALRLADVVVWCEEIGRSSSPPEHLACDVRVGTKSDLGRDEACGMSEIEVSSRTGAGLDALVERLVGILVTKEGRKGESSLSARVAGSLREARTALDQARQTHGSAVGHEFVAMLVREALDPLGEIGGAVFTDDLLDRIFSKFCIGK